MITDEQFAELLAFVDEAAGRRHSPDGEVAKTLRAALARHALMLAPDPPCRTCQEYGYLFQMQSLRMQEATALWRSECPEERALIMPDLGVLLAWLMDRRPRKGLLMDVARSLLGRWVVVTVDRERLETGSGESFLLPVEFSGTLHSVSEDGEVVLVGEDGVRSYCWPLLAIREEPHGTPPPRTVHVD